MPDINWQETDRQTAEEEISKIAQNEIVRRLAIACEALALVRIDVAYYDGKLRQNAIDKVNQAYDLLK